MIRCLLVLCLTLVIVFGPKANRVVASTSKDFGIHSSVVMLSSAYASDLPNARLTPGAVRTTSENAVCSVRSTRKIRQEIIPGASSREDRRALQRLKRELLREYGLRYAPGAYEFDHLIPLELGGSGSLPGLRSNLWPQPRNAYWGSAQKDALENRMHELACSDQVPLARLQNEIAHDWIASYKKYVAPSPQGEVNHFNR